MKFAIGCVALTLALSLAACSADDPKTKPTADASSPTDGATDAGYPAFEPADYTYVLTRSAYRPFTVPVRITVENGEVTEAVARERAATIRKGDPAPESLRLTINDIIDLVNESRADSVEVDWPDGQAWPSRVRIDQIQGALDDEVVYVISDVQVR